MFSNITFGLNCFRPMRERVKLNKKKRFILDSAVLADLAARVMLLRAGNLPIVTIVTIIAELKA